MCKAKLNDFINRMFGYTNSVSLYVIFLSALEIICQRDDFVIKTSTERKWLAIKLVFYSTNPGNFHQTFSVYDIAYRMG